MDKHRRHFSPEDKVRALRGHLVEKVPISNLCEELGIQPTQFYRWQQTLFENGPATFDRAGRPKADAEALRIAALEAKIRRKDEVLAELMEEHVWLKKNLIQGTRDTIPIFAPAFGFVRLQGESP